MTDRILILSDPPWPQQKGGKRKCRPNQGRELDYPVLTLGDITGIHERIIAEHPGCNVFLWAIDKYLPEAEVMMSDMGYTLHARFIWDKENGIAPAFTVRFAHEYLLWYYRKGSILMPTQEARGRYATVMREPSTKHSKKPECAYAMLETMFPDARKIELFARQERNGWECHGDEIDGADLRQEARYD